jgi:hypothetical protein
MLPVEIVVCADIVDDTIVAKTANTKTRVKRQCQSEGAIQYLPAHKIFEVSRFQKHRRHAIGTRRRSARTNVKPVQ